MKFLKIIPLAPFNRYVGLCIVESSQEFNEFFGYDYGTDGYLSDIHFNKAKALTIFTHLSGVVADLPELDYEQQMALIVIQASDRAIRRITPGVLAHEYWHVVSKFIELMTDSYIGEVGSFGDECAASMMEFLVDELTPAYEQYLETLEKTISSAHSIRFIPDSKFQTFISSFSSLK